MLKLFWHASTGWIRRETSITFFGWLLAIYKSPFPSTHHMCTMWADGFYTTPARKTAQVLPSTQSIFPFLVLHITRWKEEVIMHIVSWVPHEMLLAKISCTLILRLSPDCWRTKRTRGLHFLDIFRRIKDVYLSPSHVCCFITCGFSVLSSTHICLRFPFISCMWTRLL